MIGNNLKHITSQHVASASLTDGVEGAMLGSYKIEEAGRYLVLAKYTLRISVTAASLARGQCLIKINGTSAGVGADGFENHWDSGGSTTGDIDMTTTKHTFATLNEGDVITIVPIITKRGGTITAYALYNFYFSLFKVEE